MSEWLTTGQLVDQMQVGEVAELKFDENVGYSKDDTTNHYVVRLQDSIRWCMGEDGKVICHPLQLSGNSVNYKWRIIPQYVSFEEAMKALQEGKIVNVFMDGKKYRFKAENPYILEELGGYSFKNLFEAKWTVDK